MAKADRQEAARAHRERCKGRYRAVDDGAWRAYLCSACGHVSGCECAGEATDCVDDRGTPLRATELPVVHVAKREEIRIDGAHTHDEVPHVDGGAPPSPAHHQERGHTR